MLKKSVLLIDNEFAGNPKNGDELLIQISGDSFSYAIIDRETKTPKALFCLQDEPDLKYKLISIFENDALLSSDFASIKATILTSKVTFIPAEYFAEEQVQDFSRILETKNNLMHRHHSSLAIDILFDVEEEFLKALPKETVCFPSLSALSACITGNNNDYMLLDFNSNSVSFLYFKENQLQLQQNFAFADLDEFTYYLLLVKEQLDIPSETEILVQGLIDEHDEFFDRIVEYFSKVRLNSIDYIFQGEFAEQLPAHYFNNLLALQACE